MDEPPGQSICHLQVMCIAALPAPGPGAAILFEASTPLAKPLVGDGDTISFSLLSSGLLYFLMATQIPLVATSNSPTLSAT